MPVVLEELARLPGRRLFDLGCGDGRGSVQFANRGYEVTGVDMLESGIAFARRNFPEVRFELGSCTDNLAEKYGRFPIVVSIEVIEHLYDPRAFMRTAMDLLEPSGSLVISTPFHGYWKNLALSLRNKWDQHHDPLFDHGHIKFWSIPTLTKLLQEFKLEKIHFTRAGRLPAIAKSMIAVARKPA